MCTGCVTTAVVLGRKPEYSDDSNICSNVSDDSTGGINRITPVHKSFQGKWKFINVFLFKVKSLSNVHTCFVLYVIEIAACSADTSAKLLKVITQTYLCNIEIFSSFNFFLYFSYFCSKLRLWEVVLMSTHNLYFGAKIRKIGIPLHTPVLLYKVGFKRVYITWTCFRDVRSTTQVMT